MGFRDNIRSFFERLKEKHNLSFTDDSTYDEKWSFRLSMLNLYTLLSFYTILIVVAIFLLIRFTPLSGFFVGGVNNVTWNQVEKNSEVLDSMNAVLKANQLYVENLMKILNDEPFEDSLNQPNDSLYLNYKPNFEKSKEDSILRFKIENIDESNPDVQTEMGIFFAPVEGTVSKSFNIKTMHLGVDVVTAKDEPVKVCLNGTIIFSGWSPDDGNLIIVQHNNDLISVYKHCAVLLKETGDQVREGDPIGIVGNTGEKTSGPHLHFELWNRGVPVNPQEFISF